MIHLRCSQIDGISRTMILLKNQPNQPINLGHTNPASNPQGTPSESRTSSLDSPLNTLSWMRYNFSSSNWRSWICSTKEDRAFIKAIKPTLSLEIYNWTRLLASLGISLANGLLSTLITTRLPMLEVFLLKASTTTLAFSGWYKMVISWSFKLTQVICAASSLDPSDWRCTEDHDDPWGPHNVPHIDKCSHDLSTKTTTANSESWNMNSCKGVPIVIDTPPLFFFPP